MLRSLSVPHYLPTLMDWIVRVRQGLDTADTDYPFLPAARRTEEDQAPRGGDTRGNSRPRPGYLSAASAIRMATAFIDSPFASVELTE